MFEDFIVGLLVAGISGVVGFTLKSRFFTKSKYLPEIQVPHDNTAYKFIEGTWHEYHITYDPKVSSPHFIAHSVLQISLEKNLIVVGECTVQVEHRRALNYKIRGQINSGNLYYTAVCVEDPSDAYSAMFKNLLDDQIVGIISGWDYEKSSYSSPILLSKEELDSGNVEKILHESPAKFFSVNRVGDEI